MLHTSGSVGAEDFRKQVSLVESVASFMTVEASAVRVGVSGYGRSGVTHHFWMDDHMDGDNLTQALSQLQHVPGRRG